MGRRGDTGMIRQWRVTFARLYSMNVQFFPVSWLQVRRSAVPHGGIWNRELLVTRESRRITERTISVCNNHTELWGFIRSMTGGPLPEPTPAWLHDDQSRFSTLIFSNREKDRCKASQLRDSATFKIVGDGGIYKRGNKQRQSKQGYLCSHLFLLQYHFILDGIQ